MGPIPDMKSEPPPGYIIEELLFNSVVLICRIWLSLPPVVATIALFLDAGYSGDEVEMGACIES